MTDPLPPLSARIVELSPQPAVAARVQTPWAELDIGALFDRLIPEVAERVADLGGEIAGPPYARYHAFGPDGTDIELGVPVTAPVPNLRRVSDAAPGEVAATELPAGPAAVTVHVGGYDRLSETYDRLRAWIAAQGRTLGGAPWESYVDDPSEVADEGSLRTEVVWPLG